MNLPRPSLETLSPRGEAELRLLVALPALNEAATIGSVIERVPQHLPGIGSIEVLVVDDGSSDSTASLAAAAGAAVIRHSLPEGVGAAFHSALAYAIDEGFDLIVTIDADGQFDPAYIPELVAPVASGQADFATASRFKDPALTPKMPLLKLWGNRMMSSLISSLAGTRFYDVSCGMRCYNRRAALHLHLLARFTYTQEVFLNLAFKRLRIVEVPLPVHERPRGESRVAKSLWRYGWQTSKIIFRCYRDYHPMRFFGGLAILLLIPAASLGGLLLMHYLRTGSLSPQKWAGFGAMGFTSLAIAMLLLGVIGDMMTRHRVYLEEILYRSRAGSGSAPPPGGHR